MKFLVYSALIGYSIFLVLPMGLTGQAISSGAGVYAIVVIFIDVVLLLPLISFLRKKETTRILLGIYSAPLFILFSFLPVVQHEVDLTFEFYILYGAILFLFSYIFIIMFFNKGVKRYFKDRGYPREVQ